MGGKFLIGAASAALLAFGATAAKAADVMPVVVPVITPVVAVETGPTIEIASEHWIEFGLYPAEEAWDLNTFHDLDVKITAPSGFGFQFYGAAVLWFPPPIGVEGEVTGRAFMTRGDHEVGLYSTVWFDGGFNGFGIGTDFSFENDVFTLESYVQAEFYGGFQGVRTGAEVSVALGDRFEVGADIELWLDGGGAPIEEVGAYAQAFFGPIAPYVAVWWDGDLGFDVGAELELPLGNSPLSLLGYAEAEFQIGAPVEYFFGVGIKFSLGD